MARRCARGADARRSLPMPKTRLAGWFALRTRALEREYPGLRRPWPPRSQSRSTFSTARSGLRVSEAPACPRGRLEGTLCSC